jgi:putative NADH-flavin reductase
MTNPPSESPLDPYKDLLGVDFTSERLDENLQAFADILEALKKLRELDLTEVHPAVVFDPAGPYRGEADS